MTQLSQIVNISHTRLTLERNDVARILAYLEENFDRPIRIGSLAADMGFSESQLRRVFKEQTGSEDCSWLIRKVADHGGQAAYFLYGCEHLGHHRPDFEIQDEINLPVAFKVCLNFAQLINGQKN